MLDFIGGKAVSDRQTADLLVIHHSHSAIHSSHPDSPPPIMGQRQTAVLRHPIVSREPSKSSFLDILGEKLYDPTPVRLAPDVTVKIFVQIPNVVYPYSLFGFPRRHTFLFP